MNQSLILKHDNKKIAVVRNTYERAVFHYMHSMDWVGFDTWLYEGKLSNQLELYKNCDYFIDWSTILYISIIFSICKIFFCSWS